MTKKYLSGLKEAIKIPYTEILSENFINPTKWIVNKND